MVHKPKHKVHSFRGLLGDGGQDEINLERQNLNVAYRITKFEIIPELPGASYSESVVQVWREEQSSASATIDFNDPDLLAAAFVAADTAAHAFYSPTSIIFDNTLFSRNIYVTNQELQSTSTNYYIEIEEVPVSASALIQLKLGTARRIKTKESMG